MSRFVSSVAVASLTALLSGCGSFIASVSNSPIESDPGSRSFAQRVLDESIEIKAIVNTRVANKDFYGTDMVVTAFNGYVLICGSVPDRGLIQLASDTVREIEGVRRIYNELTVKPTVKGQEPNDDPWITTKVKANLLANPQTPSTRVKVVTENGIVYLMGLLTLEEAERVKAEAASVEGVVKVVSLIELI